jgi:hypothetical protein
VVALLDQVRFGFGNAVNEFGEAIGAGPIGSQASVASDEIVSTATTSVAQLLNSGVNRNGKITGPLAEHFGSDPVTFTLNMVKHFDSFMRGVCNRVADRTGNAEFSVPASTGKGGSVKVAAKVSNKQPSAHVALVCALNATQNPGVLLEEAGRQQQGLPAKRGLDGPFIWYPPGQVTARGFFGIDEAAAAAACLAILVAVAPAIIGALISVVGSIVPGLAEAVGLGPKKPPPPPPGLFGIEGLDPLVAIAIAAAIAAAAFLLLRKKHA